MEFRRILLAVCLILGAMVTNAQDNFFVYLQTENSQPFYARINNKVVSSTTSGYMILPKLKEGRYDVSIGFPKNESNEKKFTIEVNNKSGGYLLKNFEDKGWSLFNLQTHALLSPNSGNVGAVASSVSEIKEDPFSQMLASVTKDSTLLKRNKPILAPSAVPVKEQEVIAETVLKEEKTEDSKIKTSESTALMTDRNERPTEVKTEMKSEIIDNPKDVTAASSPVRILNVTGRDGSEYIYVDKGVNKSDTVTAFIPNKKVNAGSGLANKENNEIAVVKKEVEFTITPTVVSPIKEDKQNNELSGIKEEVKKSPEKTSVEETKKPASQVFIIRDDTPKEKEKSNGSIILLPPVPDKSTNSDCVNVANTNDYLKIRKRMAAGKDNDAMVFAAKRIFKTKCFSTEQIRNLSYLFLTDEGRYMFFDAAYPYTFDSDRFATLVSQLKDEYYINRFEALIQK
ncbi:MAG: hypothetical protein ABIN48_11000 [Ginsengibacter sp.]